MLNVTWSPSLHARAPPHPSVIQEGQGRNSLPTAGSLERQEREVTADDRSCLEGESWEAAIAFGVVQIRQRPVRGRLVDPSGDAVNDLRSHPLAGDGRREEFPVTLAVQVPTVQRQPVSLGDRCVPVTLHLVYLVAHEAAGFPSR